MSKQTDFIASVVPAAQASEAQYGVPASVTIAQAILETGWGNSLPPGSNNYFGIKSVAGQSSVECQTGEVVNGEPVTITAGFAAYPTPADSFTAHAKLLAENPRYLPAMAQRSDPLAFCTMLQTCGYSTSPIYALTLQTIIIQYNLKQYDGAQ